jgi:hypothetical protein
MLPKPESACFVTADISGYTGFLAGLSLGLAGPTSDPDIDLAYEFIIRESARLPRVRPPHRAGYQRKGCNE